MSVIDNLVKNKKDGTENIDWELLKTQKLYLLEITIKIGKQSIRMEGSDIGLDEKMCDKLSEIAKGGYSAKLGQRFKKASSKLHGLQKTFYKTYTTYFKPFRFVSETDLTIALENVEEIKMEAEDLRNDFIENYDEEMKAFLKTIQSTLETAEHPPNKIDEVLSRYASLYPTKDDLKGCFQILVEGPTQLKTISDHIKESYESVDKEIQKAHSSFDKQKAEIRKKYNKNQAKEKIEALETSLQSTQKNLDIIQNANENYANTLIDAVSNIKVKSKDESFGLIADLIDRYGVKGYGSISETKHNVFNKMLHRLNVLSEHENSLKQLINLTNNLHNDFLHSGVEKFQKSLSKYYVEIKNFTGDDSTGEGYEKLMLYIKNDKSYYALITDLESIEKLKDLKKLKGLIRDCKQISDIYPFRKKTIEQLFTKAKKAAHKHENTEKDIFDV